MSRRSRSRRSASTSAVIPAAPAAISGIGSTGYPGAQASPYRGFIYWPTLDPKRELTNPARREIARRIHALKSALGFPNRIITAFQNLVVGTGHIPRATTRDSEWNVLATKNYDNRASSALAYDVTGKLPGWEMQRAAYRTAIQDCDAAIVYTKSASGRTLRKLYSGLTIGNASDVSDQSRWIDGVYLDPLERAAYYRFLTEQGTRSRDIAAQDMAFLCRYPEPGSIRGESILKHAINKMIDVQEVHSSWIQQIKNSASIGYYLSAAAAAPGDQSMPAAVLKQIYGDKIQKVDRVTDGLSTEKVDIKKVFSHGNSIEEIPAGYDIKTLLDQRPHPNQKDLLEEFLRDVSWGAGMSSDLVWNIYKLGGANTRYVLADAQTFVEVEQDRMIYSWLVRDWVQETADALATGAIPPCKDPEWWAHGWTPPARVTVDFGRDGRIYLEEYSRGLITTDRYFALKGQDAREEFRAECDFALYRREEMERRGLTEADFAYQRASIALTPAAPDPADSPDPTDQPDPSEPDPSDPSTTDQP